MADDIWIYDFKTGETTNLTNNPAQDICPMWGPDNKIYFASDRDGHLNLYSTDLGTKETKQLTAFKKFDVKFPSMGKGAIVFEQAGYIWRYDLATGQAAPVPISIKEDLASDAAMRPSTPASTLRASALRRTASASSRSRAANSSPCPRRTARRVTLSNTSGAHERDAQWSPDGKWIAYLSDASGENELYIRAQDGKGEPQQITSGSDTYYFTPIWSPDSKKLLWSDRQGTPAFRGRDHQGSPYARGPERRGRDPRLRLVARQPVDHLGPAGKGHRHAKSVSVRPQRRQAHRGDGRLVRLRATPTFSDDGKYLLISRPPRDFNPTFGARRVLRGLSEHGARPISSPSRRRRPAPLAPEKR